MADLTTMSVEDLRALRTEKRAEYDALIENPTREQLEQAAAIGDEIDAIDAEESNRTPDAEALSAAQSRFASEAGDDDEDDNEADEEDDDADEGDEGASDDEPESSGGDESAEAVAVAEADGGSQASGRTTSASVKRGSRVAAMAGKTKRPAKPAALSTPGGLSIVAAGEVRDHKQGDRLSLTEVGQEVLNIAQTFGAPAGTGEGLDIRRSATAKFTIDFPAEQVIDDRSGFSQIEAALDFATDESRLQTEQGGGSLVAAGGWCAPSEVVYDLSVDATTEGMWSAPEVGVRRGGLRWPVSPNFADFYGSLDGFKQTEAQAISGTTKTCHEVDCPDFDEKRLDVTGLCIKVPILTNVGYPEVVANFTTNAMIAHQHKLNADKLAQLSTLAGTAVDLTVATNGTGEVSHDLIGGLLLLIDQERQKYRLAFSHTMEAVFPFWVKNLLKKDLARRSNRSEKAVQDAEVMAWFTMAGINPQFVYDWQPLTETGHVYPASFDVVVYPAGTVFVGTSPVISLDTIYDAASLAVNTYTGLFTEQGYLVGKRKLGLRKLKVATGALGRMGANDLDLTAA